MCSWIFVSVLVLALKNKDVDLYDLFPYNNIMLCYLKQQHNNIYWICLDRVYRYIKTKQTCTILYIKL
jgi:hypothetical protein